MSSRNLLIVVGATIEIVQVGYPFLARIGQCIGHSHSLPADLHLASSMKLTGHAMHSVWAHKQYIDAQK